MVLQLFVVILVLLIKSGLTLADPLNPPLLVQGSFDDDILHDSWERWQSSSGNAYLDQNSLTIKSDNGWWQVVQQQLDYVPSRSYRIFFRGKSNADTRLRTDIYDETDRKLLAVHIIERGKSWQNAIVNFTAPAQPGHALYLRFYPQDRYAEDGQVWIDDVFGQDNEDQNIVVNGTFDQSLSAPWYRWQANSDTAFVESSVLQINTNYYWQVVYQSFSLEPDQHYRLTFDAKTNDHSGLRVEIIDRESRQQIAMAIVPRGQRWLGQLIDFTLPKGQIRDIQLRFYPQDRFVDSGKVYIDNVVLKKMPPQENDSVSQLWEQFFVPLLKDIDVEYSSSLYNTQIDFMLLVDGLFKMNKVNEIDVLLHQLLSLIRKLPYLHQLREDHETGLTVLERRLSDETLSGSEDRRIFPVKDGDGRIIFASLDVLQFSCLLSHVAKMIVDYRPVEHLSGIERAYLTEMLPFLESEIVKQAFYHVEAPWYVPAGGNFPNMQDRIVAKLDYLNRPNLQNKSYHRAIVDQELFLFALAADLYYIDMREHLYQAEHPHMLREIRELQHGVITQRLSDDDHFLFDVGVWDDHPDHAYASHLGQEFPSQQYPASNGAWDSSHFHRFPWLMEKYRDSHIDESDRYSQYQVLLQRLAHQFVRNVVHFTDAGPLLTNFMSGSNGWYRIRDGWGYGPFTLSNTAIWGSWYTLAQYSDEARVFNDEMARMIRSTDEQVIQQRILYYGERDYQLPVIASGLRSIDLLGRGTKYEMYVFMGEALGYFNLN